MKRNKLLFLLGFAILFVACSNGDPSLMESVHEPAAVSLDLQSMRYSDLASLLSGAMDSELTVILKDGSDSRRVTLKRNTKAKVEEYGTDIALFDSQTEDSTNAILTPEYATLRLYRNGELLSYVAYKDKAKMNEIANYYQTQYLPIKNRVIDDIVTCIENTTVRSDKHDIVCVRINTTKAIDVNPIKPILKQDCLVNQNHILDNDLDSLDLLSKEGGVPIIHFILMKQKDGGCIDHEIVWQVQSAILSMEVWTSRSIFRTFFSIKDSEHKGQYNYAEPALKDFGSYLESNNPYPKPGFKAYILLKNDIWSYGEYLGLASDIGVIHLRCPPKVGISNRALSTSSSLYPYTLAHEIGHLLGAVHVGDEKDLMYSGYSPKVTPYHYLENNNASMVAFYLMAPICIDDRE